MRRVALKNTKQFWLLRVTGHTPILKSGFDTGEKQPTFANPELVLLALQPSSGSVQLELQGLSKMTDYVTTSSKPLLVEDYILEVGFNPTIEAKWLVGNYQQADMLLAIKNPFMRVSMIMEALNENRYGLKARL